MSEFNYIYEQKKFNLPVTRIKALISVVPKISKLSGEAIYLIGHATEMFIKFHVDNASILTKDMDSDDLRIQDCYDAMQLSHKFNFLRAVWYKPTFGEFDKFKDTSNSIEIHTNKNKYNNNNTNNRDYNINNDMNKENNINNNAILNPLISHNNSINNRSTMRYNQRKRKRGPGRPKGSKNKTPEERRAIQLAKSMKRGRGRGRPKGSLNKINRRSYQYSDVYPNINTSLQEYTNFRNSQRTNNNDYNFYNSYNNYNNNDNNNNNNNNNFNDDNNTLFNEHEFDIESLPVNHNFENESIILDDFMSSHFDENQF